MQDDQDTGRLPATVTLRQFALCKNYEKHDNGEKGRVNEKKKAANRRSDRDKQKDKDYQTDTKQKQTDRR